MNLTHSSRQLHRAGVVILVAAIAGCTLEEKTPPPVVDSLFFDADPAKLTSTVQGYAWDPEAWALTMARCGPSYCNLPPVIGDYQPLYQLAAVKDAEISLYDAAVKGAFAKRPPKTTALGLWQITQVPERRGAYYYTTSSADGQLSPVVAPPGITLVPVPASTYQPTRTLQAIETHSSACYFREAALISRTGVIEAVAKKLTSSGTPTTPADLVDPTRYSAFIIFWLYKPDVPNVKIPADGTTLSVSAGAVFNIDWEEPGSRPAAEQSDRGFLVSATPESPLGIVAVVVPATGVRRAITVSAADPVVRASSFRPWVSLPFEVTLVPGMVSSLSLHFNYGPSAGIGPGFRSAPFFCLPK